MRVIETSLDEDLSLFSRYLWQQRVRHRVFEERGQQVLELAEAGDVDAVRAAYRAWQTGSLQIQAVAAPLPSVPGSRLLAALRRHPVLSLLIALALVIFPFSLPIADGRITAVLGWLAILDPRTATLPLPTLAELLARGEVWRWITPMLLHFSVLHLAFNCAVVIELGRRVEDGLGGRGFGLLVLGLAVSSNLLQYAYAGNPLFGGLSGVAYGLLGFVLVSARRDPGRSCWQLPHGLALGLLLFLVLFSTGITEPFGLRVANAAHWGGLVAGAVAALFRSRTGPNQRS